MPVFVDVDMMYAMQLRGATAPFFHTNQSIWSMPDCVRSGPSVLFRGWVPAFVRLVPVSDSQSLPSLRKLLKLQYPYMLQHVPLHATIVILVTQIFAWLRVFFVGLNISPRQLACWLWISRWHLMSYRFAWLRSVFSFALYEQLRQLFGIGYLDWATTNANSCRTAKLQGIQDEPGCHEHPWRRMLHALVCLCIVTV